MQIYRRLFGFVAVLAMSSYSTAASATDRKAWITMGDAAFRQVRQLVPGVASIESRQLAGGEQTIHVVSVSEAKLETVAGAIHQRLQQCEPPRESWRLVGLS